MSGEREVEVGGTRCRIATTRRGDDWAARAVTTDGSQPAGAECSGTTETEAVDRLIRWIEWQHEHAVALEALQQAERAYHRTIAGSAFVSPIEGPSAVELQHDALEVLRAARLRLDEVRSREP